MRFNLIGNPTSPGLFNDAKILRALLESVGHQVHDIDMFSTAEDREGRGADLNIFLESLNEGRYLEGWAKANWFFVNPEWYFPKWDAYLSQIAMTFCKTRDAYELWCRRFGADRCAYVGFESLDRYDPASTERAGFLHVCGKSNSKGTQYIAQAWQGLWQPLTVVTYFMNPGDQRAALELSRMFNGATYVTRFQQLSEVELTALMNRHRFFILPSLQEGFGHALHEALSAKMAVLTTDAPSMNESVGLDPEFLIPVSRAEPRLCSQFHHVSPVAIRETVNRVADLSSKRLEEIGERARKAYLEEREAFRTSFLSLVDGWGATT